MAAVRPFQAPSVIASGDTFFHPETSPTEGLPVEISEIHRIAARHKIESYFVSEGLINDQPLYRRLVESLYPIKPSQQSPFVFLKASEDVLTGCDILDNSPAVKLVRCG